MCAWLQGRRGHHQGQGGGYSQATSQAPSQVEGSARKPMSVAAMFGNMAAEQMEMLRCVFGKWGKAVGLTVRVCEQVCIFMVGYGHKCTHVAEHARE